MKICFYAPFKPLDHPHPSGDLVIATGLFEYLSRQNHMWAASPLRLRWIYKKPWLWPYVLRERLRVLRQISRVRPHLWLTYITYYKAPDLLGSWVSRRANLPYVIFQGVYSTKRKKDWKTWPGYFLNKKVLCRARHVFTNKRVDFLNLKRLLPLHRITYVAPGIYSKDFSYDAKARSELRTAWHAGDEAVILSAAMFRPGVKTEGLSLLIRACGELSRRGRRFQLVIAGDGLEKKYIETLADKHLPHKVRFVGKISRNEMYRFYSAGDIFAFPGIRESLGMVFLEAQSCGLPVVAFANRGVPEVVKEGETGLLVPPYDLSKFALAIESLLLKNDLRKKMGSAARLYVRQEHDLNKNYRSIENVLNEIAAMR